MPSVTSSGPPGLARYVAGGVLGLMLLIATTSNKTGAELKLVKQTPDPATISNFMTCSVTGSVIGLNAQKCALRTNGNFVSSGAGLFKGAVSGATLNLNVGVGAGKSTCYQSGGRLSYCQTSVGADGGCACK